MIAAIFFAAAQALAQPMTFTADRIAADNATGSVAATGHIVAVSWPLTIRSESLSRDPEGALHFDDPTYATTCSNEFGHTHWNVTGEIRYKDKGYVILRNAWLRLYEVPVFWFPYLYYPLDLRDTGFSWMPGYTGRWGAYLLTKYSYHLWGDSAHADSTWWLSGATRLDLRYRKGVALGEDLKWNLGDFGSGSFNVYYAWDQDPGNDSHWHNYNWGSEIDTDRYGINLTHRWEATERDTVRLRGSVYSDSYFREDFVRKTLFNWKSQFVGYDNSGLFWEHLENNWAIGAEVSGRLNDFYGMTGRLPELYFDVNPMPVFGLPVNYETQNRIGYLRRDPAEYDRLSRDNVLSVDPGDWAEYDAFRFDTYHRLTAPFKTAGDVLSVVPRVGYHGTFWSDSGAANISGVGRAAEEGELVRTILEGGMTFSGRGTAWVNRDWRHLIEPYFDVLAQKAWLSGSGDRPYVFDSIDASTMWEDQFAGRARNLPYTYYGVTPGIRNAWEKLDERGNLRPVVDFDVYAALQFGETSYAGGERDHRLADPNRSNYGQNACFVSPGARIRWTPEKDISLLARIEYDSDNNTIAMADFGFQQVVSETFKYHANYALREYRIWDFSSVPDSAEIDSEDLNYVKVHCAEIGFEHQPLDWFAWGPYIRWDLREQELDCIGSWFDYLTDCLGFRFIVEYENSYRLINGYEHKDDWSFGFYVYLRAFGANNASLMR